MGQACCHHETPHAPRGPCARYRRVLWIALAVNAAMFAIEIAGGLQSASVSLLADAVDFFGDAVNYGLSLAVLGLGFAWRARAALFKGWTMGLYGAAVLVHALWSAATGRVPDPLTMGLIGALALTANVSVALLLYRFRDGDANMRSVWLCTRNDAIGNLAVLAAAAGVFGTGTRWPDLAVAATMAVLALTAAFSVVRQARGELAAA
ncbi:cation transporter [Aquincola sp. S2]|uniref:Cation transporter n=1 Tax=Pseudaquabacterium terrae TaxID=2732868 RepID=A0ABX2ECK5_9BURK|nr:cation transporter [Aquabacterium terrae]NRF65638.1 cation transporter [Aquabacterium terrae]